MHSAEPFEDRTADEASHASPSGTDWRAEVASRVHRYRTRHPGSAAESYALDFTATPSASPDVRILHEGSEALPPSTGTQRTASVPPATEPAGQPRAAGSRRQPHSSADNSFDTNYYRRLNAETLIAIEAEAQREAEIQHEEEEAAHHAQPYAQPAQMDREQNSAPLSEARAVQNDVNEAPEPSWDFDTHPAASAGAVDLELHPAASSEAALDRYYLAGSDSELLWKSAETPSGEGEATEAEPETAAPQGNLIVFPRTLHEPPLMPAPARDELAEPVHSRPRILEVPEDIMPAVQGSLFPEIRLDADESEAAERREPEIEISLPVAPVEARLMAGLTDLAIVAAAGALFAAIAVRALPQIPHAKTFWMAMGAVTLLWWAVYQCLFLLYAGRTVGMSMRGIRLSTFDGRPPQWAERRRRARFTLVSFAAVALGFLWALVDEDSLCWHDRLSQTFPTLE
jgi:uncharacterized RDD family membrane protein YckC